MAAPRRQPRYFPGQAVPATGIYRVDHTGHRQPHEVIAIQGEVFPGCRRCRDEVSFTLLRQTDYMTQDMDLAGPLWDDNGKDDAA